MGVVSGIVGGLVAAALGALAIRYRKAVKVDSQGWRTLRPGMLIHGTTGFLVILAPIFGFFAVQSLLDPNPPDDAWALYILSVASSLGLLYFAYAGYLRRIAWRGQTIRITTPFAHERSYALRDIASIGSNIDGSGLKLRMRDGSTIQVSHYFHGVDQLLEAIGQENVSAPTIRS